jgi:hypothetical protein
VGDWPVTVAVKVTVALYVDGFGLAARALVLLAWFTVTATALDVLALLLASPA